MRTVIAFVIHPLLACPQSLPSVFPFCKQNIDLPLFIPVPLTAFNRLTPDALPPLSGNDGRRVLHLFTKPEGQDRAINNP
jgi:hypothetical protein